MCAGEGKRWKGNFPKSLAQFNGKLNIMIIVDMLINESILKDDIIVIVNNNIISQFSADLNLYIGSSKREIDRFKNGFSFMEDCERVIFLYGDVLYHIDDMKTILSMTNDTFLGRKERNKITQKSHGEIFAVVITNFDKFKNNVNNVAYKFEINQIKREIGWDVYHNDIYNFIELSLYTDDYDTSIEYNKLKKLYNILK